MHDPEQAISKAITKPGNMAFLDGEISKLSEAFHLLRDRLGPILSQSPQVGGDISMEPPETALGDQINRLRSLNHSLGQLIEEIRL